MHEIGLMQDAIDIVVDRARRCGASHVRSVRLKVGEDSGIVPDSLRFAFDILSGETIAKGASLEIETVPVRCYCHGCAREFISKSAFYECPTCGHPTADVHTGREFQLVSVEVD